MSSQRWPLAKTWTRWTKQAGLGVAGASGLVPSVFLTEGDLDGLGADEGRAACQRDAADLEVVGEKELSELGKYCASCRAVT